METVKVHLGTRSCDRSYDILIGHSLADLGQTLRQRGMAADVMVFTSPRIGNLYYARLEAGLREAGFFRIGRHDIPDGEKNKNTAEWEKAINALATFSPSPDSVPLVINLGGGVVGDLGGFAAASFRRGVPYVQVPTTLLADVDCGVGGKVGVNFGQVKNLIGTYYQPKLVFVDLTLLKTLTDREIRSGIAEVIKYGTVCRKELFEYLEENIERLISLDMRMVLRIVRDCYSIKAKIVEEEEDEHDDSGVRIVLNFGHTIGHALEIPAGYEMTHGEAVSIGMVAATEIAIQQGVCEETLLERLKNLLTRAGLPLDAKQFNIPLDVVMDTMRHDKKFVHGTNHFVLPVACGQWCEREGIPETLVRGVVEAHIV